MPLVGSKPRSTTAERVASSPGPGGAPFAVKIPFSSKTKYAQFESRVSGGRKPAAVKQHSREGRGVRAIACSWGS